jgi:hypothetical protein
MSPWLHRTNGLQLPAAHAPYSPRPPHARLSPTPASVPRPRDARGTVLGRLLHPLHQAHAGPLVLTVLSIRHHGTSSRLLHPLHQAPLRPLRQAARLSRRRRLRAPDEHADTVVLTLLSIRQQRTATVACFTLSAKGVGTTIELTVRPDTAVSACRVRFSRYLASGKHSQNAAIMNTGVNMSRLSMPPPAAKQRAVHRGLFRCASPTRTRCSQSRYRARSSRASRR